MKLKALTIDIDPKALTFDTLRALTDEFLKSNPKEGKRYWDCMAALRGPDVGLPDADGKVVAALANGQTPGPEHARVQRKHTTSAIIRAHMFPGAAGCSAAQMNMEPDAHIVLPAKDLWDHFDKHIFKAAVVLGLPVQIGDEPLLQAPTASGDKVMAFVTGVDIYDTAGFSNGDRFMYLGPDSGPGGSPQYHIKSVKTGNVYFFTTHGTVPWQPHSKLTLLAHSDGAILLAPAKSPAPPDAGPVFGQADQVHLPSNPWDVSKGYYHPIGNYVTYQKHLNAIKAAGMVVHTSPKDYSKTQFILNDTNGPSLPSFHLYEYVGGSDKGQKTSTLLDAMEQMEISKTPTPKENL